MEFFCFYFFEHFKLIIVVCVPKIRDNDIEESLHCDTLQLLNFNYLDIVL